MLKVVGLAILGLYVLSLGSWIENRNANEERLIIAATFVALACLCWWVPIWAPVAAGTLLVLFGVLLGALVVLSGLASGPSGLEDWVVTGLGCATPIAAGCLLIASGSLVALTPHP